MKRFTTRLRSAVAAAGLLLAAQCCYAADASPAPQNFLYTSSDDLRALAPLIQRPDIAGVQVVYNWKMLETSPGRYDFSRIDRDLAYLQGLRKQLFIQIQDRFFEPQARYVPQYLLEDRVYQGGLVPQFDHPGEGRPIGNGWVAQQWNPAVRGRYQRLLAALADRFDARVAGINLPETAIDLDMKRDNHGFSCDRYFAATLDNLGFAKRAFRRSQVVQYVNFWPCEWNDDHRYMSRLFAFAQQNGIGLGGPDIVPGKASQMKNAYPFFHRYKGKLALVAMAVQEPTLTYIDPQTGKPFTREAFTRYAQDYLGAGIIFWSAQSPWLR
ncbi:hypothetical protein [Burkholderia alba]|uniref:hypothetical protein n=1 Tax=Burkholderia alba TaxID=2683677 RepID=UPI002B06108A|nr:hypothetical protein [Burkholderia alba]